MGFDLDDGVAVLTTISFRELRFLKEKAKSLLKQIYCENISEEECNKMSLFNKLNISRSDILLFCHKYHIKKLALFGSALKGQLRPESDIDILVEFDEEHIPSLFQLIEMEEELSNYFEGRKVDLRTPKDLSRYFRNEVIETAEVLHLEA